MKDNVNLYTYVANSPINYNDPFGKEKVLIIWWEESISAPRALEAVVDYNRQLLWKNGYKLEDITDKRAYNVSDLESILQWIDKWSTKYNKIIIAAHWSRSSITLSDGDNGELNINTLSQLQVSSDFNTTIQLESCQTWEGDNSIWEQLAKQLWTTVYAPDTFLSINYTFSTKEWSKSVHWTYSNEDGMLNDFYDSYIRHTSLQDVTIPWIPISLRDAFGWWGYSTFRY